MQDLPTNAFCSIKHLNASEEIQRTSGPMCPVPTLLAFNQGFVKTIALPEHQDLEASWVEAGNRSEVHSR